MSANPQLRLPRGTVELVLSAQLNRKGAVDSLTVFTYLHSSKGMRCLGFLSASPENFEVRDPDGAGDSHSILASCADRSDPTARARVHAGADVLPAEASRIREWLKALPA